MMLPQTQRGQEIERHRRDQIVIFRRADICAVMRVSWLEAAAETFPRRFHVTSLVSMWRSRNPSMRLAVCREIRRCHATCQIDRCASAVGHENEFPLISNHHEFEIV